MNIFLAVGLIYKEYDYNIFWRQIGEGLMLFIPCYAMIWWPFYESSNVYPSYHLYLLYLISSDIRISQLRESSQHRQINYQFLVCFFKSCSTIPSIPSAMQWILRNVNLRVRVRMMGDAESMDDGRSIVSYVDFIWSCSSIWLPFRGNLVFEMWCTLCSLQCSERGSIPDDRKNYSFIYRWIFSWL